MSIRLFKIFTVLVLVYALSSCGKFKGDSAEISYIQGDVTVNGDAAKTGQVIPPASLVRTGEGSGCELIFKSKNVIEIAENTELLVNISSSNRSLFLKSGSIGQVLKNLTKKSASDSPLYQVESSAAVASVRGTSFFMHVDGGVTYICDCNGKLEMSDVLGVSNINVEAAHHKAYVFSNDTQGVIITEGELKYHNDASMQKLADKIGYKIDWSKLDN